MQMRSPRHGSSLLQGAWVSDMSASGGMSTHGEPYIAGGIAGFVGNPGGQSSSVLGSVAVVDALL